jgi:hypothetical protein
MVKPACRNPHNKNRNKTGVFQKDYLAIHYFLINIMLTTSLLI